MKTRLTFDQQKLLTWLQNREAGGAQNISASHADELNNIDIASCAKVLLKHGFIENDLSSYTLTNTGREYGKCRSPRTNRFFDGVFGNSEAAYVLEDVINRNPAYNYCGSKAAHIYADFCTRMYEILGSNLSIKTKVYVMGLCYHDSVKCVKYIEERYAFMSHLLTNCLNTKLKLILRELKGE